MGKESGAQALSAAYRPVTRSITLSRFSLATNTSDSGLAPGVPPRGARHRAGGGAQQGAAGEGRGGVHGVPCLQAAASAGTGTMGITEVNWRWSTAALSNSNQGSGSPSSANCSCSHSAWRPAASSRMRRFT